MADKKILSENFRENAVLMQQQEGPTFLVVSFTYLPTCNFANEEKLSSNLATYISYGLCKYSTYTSIMYH